MKYDNCPCCSTPCIVEDKKYIPRKGNLYRLSKIRNKKAISLLMQGKSYKEICQELDLNYREVISVFVRQGIKNPSMYHKASMINKARDLYKTLDKEDMTRHKKSIYIAKVLGLSKQTVQKYIGMTE